MPSLRDIQVRSHRAFIEGDFDAIDDFLAAGALSRTAQVNVYQNNARETFRKALLAAYPVVAKLVGDDCFAGLAAKYLREHPSMDSDLQHFGDKFPGGLMMLIITILWSGQTFGRRMVFAPMGHNLRHAGLS